MRPGLASGPLLLALLAALAPARAQEDPGARGPRAVESVKVKVPKVGWFGTHLQVRYPRGPVAPGPVVLICHGWAAGSCKFVPLAEHLASRGIVAASFKQPDIFSSDLPRWGRQLRAGLDALLAAGRDPRSPLFGRLDPGRVALLGHSYGAAASVLVASQDLSLRGVVGLATVNQPHRALLLESGARLRGPLLLVTGQRDPLATTRGYVLPLFQAAAGAARRELLEVAGGGHDLYVGSGERAALARRHATAWLEHALGLRPADAWIDGRTARRDRDAGTLSRIELGPGGIAAVLGPGS